MAMSAAWAALGPGVSITNGTPATAGWRSSAPKGRAPIWPAPMFSCRSRYEPHGSLESLACTRPSRPVPPRTPVSSFSAAAAPPRAVRSRPARTRGRCPGTLRRAGATRAVQVRTQIGHGGAEHLALAGHRFQQQVRAVGRDRVQHRQQAFPRVEHALVPVAARRRAGVHHHAVGADRAALVQRVPHRGHGTFADQRVRGPDVDQVRRVDEHRQARLAQPVPDGVRLAGLLRRVSRRQGPGARVGHEHLDRLGADVGRRSAARPRSRRTRGHVPRSWSAGPAGDGRGRGRARRPGTGRAAEASATAGAGVQGVALAVLVHPGEMAARSTTGGRASRRSAACCSAAIATRTGRAGTRSARRRQPPGTGPRRSWRPGRDPARNRCRSRRPCCEQPGASE